MDEAERSNPKTALGGFGEVAMRDAKHERRSDSGRRATPAERASVPPSHPSSSALGRVIAGKYRITELIGEGGMGTVWQAEHLGLKKRVAIKLVSAVHSSQPEVAARFKREAQAASLIESDHVVQIHDVGADPELGLFMAMELLQGEDLAHLLAREKAIDPFAACCLIAQTATSLAKAHRAGIVHRDLKPANLFLARRDDGSVVVKILDFGIAKFVRDVESQRSGALTRIGRAIGTAQYMSPEQAQGFADLDGRSDIYSLGAVLYEAVCGEPLVPELRSYEQMIVRVLTHPLPCLADCFPPGASGLAALLADMLAKQREERVQDMTAVVSRILALHPQALDARVFVASEAPGSERARVSFADISPRVQVATRGSGVSVQRTTRLGLGTSAGVTHEPVPDPVPAPTPGMARARAARRAGLATLAAVGALGVAGLVVWLSSGEGEPGGAALAAATGHQPWPSRSATGNTPTPVAQSVTVLPEPAPTRPAPDAGDERPRAAPKRPTVPPGTRKPPKAGAGEKSSAPSSPRTGSAGVSEEF